MIRSVAGKSRGAFNQAKANGWGASSDRAVCLGRSAVSSWLMGMRLYAQYTAFQPRTHRCNNSARAQASQHQTSAPVLVDVSWLRHSVQVRSAKEGGAQYAVEREGTAFKIFESNHHSEESVNL